jgi:NAD(P)-dependent dehydrogenase (short-subunit alcohol dehydrogenase family)
VIISHQWRTPKYLKSTKRVSQFIVNVTTGSIHGTQHPAVAARPAYTVSKLSGTLFFQCLAQDIPHDKVQVLSFHPGLIYNDYWKSLGIGSEHFDDGEPYRPYT